jgi:hypothetical protein
LPLAGEVAEWLKAPLSKSGILAKPGSWVQIPPSPPYRRPRRRPEDDGGTSPLATFIPMGAIADGGNMDFLFML